MADQRMKNANWIVSEDGERSKSVEHSQLAVLMDIRDELQKLNTLLHCSNFIAIPRTLKRISANTAKRRKPKGTSP